MDPRKQIGCVFLISIMLLIFTFNMPICFAQPEAAVNSTEEMDATNATEAAEIAEADIPDIEPLPLAPDPYEKFNRGIFAFNDKIDTYFLRPIANLYNAIMPGPLNLGIHNVFNNLNTIPTIINDLLQLHLYQAASDMWRLAINTTLGIGGLFDVAARIGLDPYTNDFGLTLATWGYKNSNFFVIPFFGPSTIRDGIEIPVDYYLLSIYPSIHPVIVRYGVYGLSVVDRRAQLLKFQSVMEEVAIDKYIFQRNAYMQRRQYQIDQNDCLGIGEKERTPRVTLEENKPSSVNIGTS